MLCCWESRANEGAAGLSPGESGDADPEALLAHAASPLWAGGGPGVQMQMRRSRW